MSFDIDSKEIWLVSVWALPTTSQVTSGSLSWRPLSFQGVRCPLLALSGHSQAAHRCPFSEVKGQTLSIAPCLLLSANDPKRTLGVRVSSRRSFIKNISDHSMDSESSGHENGLGATWLQRE